MNTQVHTDQTDRGGPMDWTWTYDSTSSPVKWPHDSTDKSPFIPIKPDKTMDDLYEFIKNSQGQQHDPRVKELEDEVAKRDIVIKRLEKELDNYRRILSE